MFVTAMGGTIVAYEDGFDIVGPDKIRPFDIDSHGDHRIAMSAIIAAVASGVTPTIRNCECIQTSFPNFFEILRSFRKFTKIRFTFLIKCVASFLSFFRHIK